MTGFPVLTQKVNSDAATKATAHLGKYPVTMNLSEQQKDIIYSNLYSLLHLEPNNDPNIFDTKLKLLKNENTYLSMNHDKNLLVWAAREVISDEQMATLIQSPQ